MVVIDNRVSCWEGFSLFSYLGVVQVFKEVYKLYKINTQHTIACGLHVSNEINKK